jgi:hypothetical protein
LRLGGASLFGAYQSTGDEMILTEEEEEQLLKQLKAAQ